MALAYILRLFEDAVNKLNLVGLVGFLHQLRKASQSQLFNSVTETGDYSLAMPGVSLQFFISKSNFFLPQTSVEHQTIVVVFH